MMAYQSVKFGMFFVGARPPLQGVSPVKGSLAWLSAIGKWVWRATRRSPLRVEESISRMGNVLPVRGEWSQKPNVCSFLKNSLSIVGARSASPEKGNLAWLSAIGEWMWRATQRSPLRVEGIIARMGNVLPVRGEWSQKSNVCPFPKNSLSIVGARSASPVKGSLVWLSAIGKWVWRATQRSPLRVEGFIARMDCILPISGELSKNPNHCLSSAYNTSNVGAKPPLQGVSPVKSSLAWLSAIGKCI